MSGISLQTGQGYEAAVGALASLSTICVALRLLSRRVSGLPFGWDDVLIVAATILVWSLASAFIWGTSTLMGVDLFDLTAEDAIVIGKAGFMTEISYICTLTCTKISILIWYRRIFPPERLRIFIWVLTAFAAAWGVAYVIALVLGCSPFREFWNPVPSQHCHGGGGNAFVIANAVTNIAIDLPILALPIPVIWKLQIRDGKKWGLRAVFLLGAFVIIASGIRTHYLSTDLSNVFRRALWSNIEPNIAIICASLPSLMPLFRRRRRGRSSQAYSSSELRQNPRASAKRSWPSSSKRPDVDVEATIDSVDDHGGQLLVPKAHS